MQQPQQMYQQPYMMQPQQPYMMQPQMAPQPQTVMVGANMMGPGMMMPLMQPMQQQMTNDPTLQCHIEECCFLGSNTCRWDNCCMRSKRVGGCGKRYCNAHGHTRLV